MANLTIALDDRLLRKARIKAVQEGTTVNAYLRKRLRQYVGESESEPAHVKATRDFLATARNARGRSGGRKWTREELHERR